MGAYNNLKIEVDTVLEQSLKPSEDTDGKQTAEREFPDDKSIIGHLEEDIEGKEKEIAFITVDKDSEIEKLKIIIEEKSKELEEFLGVEERYKSSLRNITDLEEQMMQTDMNDETTELKLKEEIAQKTSEESGSNHQLRDELNAKPKEVEELLGIEARYKYYLQNISDLERQLVQADKNADLVVATTEQGHDLEDLFSDQDYIECLGEEPPLEENMRWRALFDTLKMCMQSGINQNAVLEHSEDDKSWTNLEVVEEASKSSINFLHEDLETQTIPESLVEQGGLAKDEVAYKKNMFDSALELEENFNKYHWNFPRMVSPYDSWKYVEEVDIRVLYWMSQMWRKRIGYLQ